MLITNHAATADVGLVACDAPNPVALGTLAEFNAAIAELCLYARACAAELLDVEPLDGPAVAGPGSDVSHVNVNAETGWPLLVESLKADVSTACKPLPG